MLTGTIPLYHGVHDNNGYKLGESNVTLAEILKDNGFVTGAIIGSIILDSKYGLDQGFDSYDDNFQDSRSPIHILERQGEETRRLACQWLDEHQKENMFLFLHFYDPHITYDAPEPYKKMFLGHPSPDPNSREHRVGMYAGEVAYTDNCIKGVLDKLKQLGLYDSTLIIITADHGEMFYQHKEQTHGYYIYEGNHSIPLVFKVPGVNTPRRIENTVGHVDITPTVCSLLDIEGPFTFQGADISPYLLQDAPVDLKRHIYLESLTPTKYKANSLLGIVNDKYKYIQTTRPELYDIVNNYQESVNLVEKYPKIAHRMQGLLKIMLDDTIALPSPDSTMEADEETLKQLEALGYVGGSVTEDFTFDTTKKDPKDLIDYHLLNTRIISVLRDKLYDQVRKMCEKMISMQPDVAKPYLYMAAIADISKDYQESIKLLNRALEIEPDDIKIHNHLALNYLVLNNDKQVNKHLHLSLKIKPDQVVIQRMLAKGYIEQKNYERAYFLLQEALSKQPENFITLNHLAMLYFRQGQADKAIEYYNKSLQIEPDHPIAMSELGAILLGQNKVSEALTLLSKVLKINPDYIFAANTLAWVKATSKDARFYDPGQALALARRTCELTEYQNSGLLDTLAAAQAAGGDFTGAVQTAQKAIDIAISAEDDEQTAVVQKHLKLYKNKQALRE
jgi:arylsulfatase A-like enzyme/Flp pilus assembly protein TadD